MNDETTGAPDYVIWGSAGHAKVLEDLIAQSGKKIIALFDNNLEAKSSLEGVDLYIGRDGFKHWCQSNDPHSAYCAVAIGGTNGQARLEILTFMEQSGLQLEPLLHPSCSVADSAIIAPGSQILANATVAAETRISRGCIVNHGAIVDHETVLAPGVHVAPGAVLTGCITVEQSAFIGAGAVILPRLTIGQGSIIGAGALVTKNVAPGSIVVGSPARPRPISN